MTTRACQGMRQVVQVPVPAKKARDADELSDSGRNERGRRIATPLKDTPLPVGILRIILQDNGQVEIHHGVDEFRGVTRTPAVKPRWVWTGTIPTPTPTVTESAMTKVWVTAIRRERLPQGQGMMLDPHPWTARCATARFGLAETPPAIARWSLPG